MPAHEGIPFRDTAKVVLARMVEEANDAGMWTGRLTALVTEEASSISAYSQVLNILTSAGAIEQVKRGGGTSPSIWQIVDANADLATGSPTPSPLRRRRGTYGERLDALERKLDQLFIDHLREHHGYQDTEA